MSTEEPIQPQDPTRDDTTMQDAVNPTEASSVGDAGATGDGTRAPRKRPRLDLAVDSRERKRGKTMFGLVLGTLNKAKNEDKARNASDAAKKRQLIEQRLQDKLRKETDSVRRAEEAKKDKTLANRKEEDLQLKDSIHKLRRTRLPLLANFLSTSDQIPTEEDVSSPPPSTDPLAPQARTHPPPVFYLPAILLPSQEVFLKRRKAEVKEAAEKEWAAFRDERKAGIEEIISLRQRVAEEETRKKSEQQEQRDTEPAANSGADVKMDDAESPTEAKTTDTNAEGGSKKSGPVETTTSQPKDMDVDDESARTDGSKTLESDSAKGSSSTTAPAPPEAPPASEPKEEPTMMQADEDDAVEY